MEVAARVPALARIAFCSLCTFELEILNSEGRHGGVVRSFGLLATSCDGFRGDSKWATGKGSCRALKWASLPCQLTLSFEAFRELA